MRIAKALRAYAESQGFTGRPGVVAYNAPHFTNNDVAFEFKVTVAHAKKLLACRDPVYSIPDYVMLSVRNKLIELNMFGDTMFKPDTHLNVPAEPEVKPEYTPPSPEDIDDLFKEIRTSHMKVKKIFSELSSELHVSNRLYKVENKIKEIRDAMISYRNNYHDCMLAAWTLMESVMKAKGEEMIDPLTADLFKERQHYVMMLDLFIEKLENL